MPGLNDSLNIGLSGLQASQAALNVVGHNIANVNTPNYSRQEALLGSSGSQTFQKVGLRSSLAVAVVSFAGMLRLSPDGCVQEARFAWGSVAPTVVRLPVLEEFLTNAPLDRDTIARGAELVREGVSPMDDLRATAEYRRSVAANLLIRFLEAL